MTWEDDLVLFVRSIIGDLDGTKYTDNRLKQVIVVAAYNVNTDASFSTTYTFDISGLSISPDPVANSDSNFTILTAFKAACFILGGEHRLASQSSILFRDGPTLMDMSSIPRNLDVIRKNICNEYDNILLNYQIGGEVFAGNGTAILGPYSPGSFLSNFRGYGYDPRC